MNDQEIKALLDKYDNGLTTAREERLLEEALLGVFLNNRQAQPAAIAEQTDTFNNPQDAQAAAGKALAKFSTALNKGLDKMNNKDYNH